MSTDYMGVKYYSDNDMSIGIYLEQAEQVIDSFDNEKEYKNVNEIMGYMLAGINVQRV